MEVTMRRMIEKLLDHINSINWKILGSLTRIGINGSTVLCGICTGYLFLINPPITVVAANQADSVWMPIFFNVLAWAIVVLSARLALIGTVLVGSVIALICLRTYSKLPSHPT